MASRRGAGKRAREPSFDQPDVALAAIASYRRQSEVSEFINFILEALERNSVWLNNVVGKQTNFRCVLMTGAGPNRFQIQKTIYPVADEDVKLEVELSESEDHDKVALAALLKLNTAEMDGLVKYMRTRMYDNALLREDVLKGKAMGISFAVLSPFANKQYRVVEHIPISSASKCLEPCKKRRREEKSVTDALLRKSKRVAW